MTTNGSTSSPVLLASGGETRDERFERGLKALNDIHSRSGQGVAPALADISPELGHSIVAWAYGDIYSRPNLAPRDRQLVTLGMLTALGGCEAELEIHINASLNVGLSPDEIIEALLQSAVYCGIPRSLNATMAAKKIFAERGLLPLGAPSALDGLDELGAGFAAEAAPREE
ncbi:carboxymuconolactone decarboxylase family protein [Streptacidiphilus anmyonensis]|uniref:carboxymuconolactone decarboxylase family protein n=1 Tax=Streptacidiphilus anmyonensis TaxID=405782 RepID=UPI000A0441D6|nr:carboxymuconolactone decarboxylase family protein [Streptacidiphilus anmyonensis]